MIAGGSSGGSAAAVAMDNCYAALGTDTGGSIRTPSAMCGVTGFKATYGRVSIRGIVPLTWSLDHCGPIARTVEDTATGAPGHRRLRPARSAEHRLSRARLFQSHRRARLAIPPRHPAHVLRRPRRRRRVARWKPPPPLLKKMTKGAQEVATAFHSRHRRGQRRRRLSRNAGQRLRALRNRRRGGGGGRGGARAVDYIREWRKLRLVRRTVDDEVFRKQNVDFLITPTIREVSWTIEEELGRAGSAAAAIQSPATRARSTITACPPSLFRADSPNPACPSACRSAARTWPRSTSSLWLTPINRPPIGTSAVRRSRPTPKFPCCRKRPRLRRAKP